VIALDLYDGKVATTQQEAGKYMGEAKEERIRAIIKGALDYVGPKAKIGTIGWCFGGGWSLQTALMAGKQTSACVMYYGMPETDVDKLKAINGPVLGIFAKKDGWINPDKVKEFEANMKKVAKKLTVKMYDADHAFANPSNPKFDKEAAADAHKAALAFLKKYSAK
jgi:carboxymethylenebutenolidase